MKEIPLTQGKVALVDDADYEYLMQWKWHASFGSRGTKWYAKRKIRVKEREELGPTQCISMHRFIMRPGPYLVTDHINDDGLDNRRENLQNITQEQNMAKVKGWNMKGPKKPHCYDLPDF